MIKASELAAQISRHLETALAAALTSIIGRRFSVSADRTGETTELEDPVIWEQSFSFCGEPALWLLAGRDLWREVGRLTLAAAGIDKPSDEDCRSTWHEILGQTMGAFASAIAGDLQQEVTASRGEELSSAPMDLPWTIFTVRDEENRAWHLKIGWSPAIASICQRGDDERKSTTSPDTVLSKTLDLLLDVALPVSVSFGRTSLQIREVLKLSTGSIVELNRLVAEPVDVLVNDCIIARGEVVVVDGNYGVRITQLSSREERLRFGMAQTSNRMGGLSDA